MESNQALIDQVDELTEQMKELKTEISFIKNAIVMDLETVGGQNNGRLQTIRIGIILKAVLKKLNIRPIFKKEIIFTDYNQKDKKHVTYHMADENTKKGE